MILGLCEFSLALPGNRSLKEKRRVVRSVIDTLRARHKIAVSEVADHDVHDRATVGFAVVGHERRVVRSVLDKALRTVDETCDADVADQEVEVLQW